MRSDGCYSTRRRVDGMSMRRSRHRVNSGAMVIVPRPSRSAARMLGLGERSPGGASVRLRPLCLRTVPRRGRRARATSTGAAGLSVPQPPARTVPYPPNRPATGHTATGGQRSSGLVPDWHCVAGLGPWTLQAAGGRPRAGPGRWRCGFVRRALAGRAACRSPHTDPRRSGPGATSRSLQRLRPWAAPMDAFARLSRPPERS